MKANQPFIVGWVRMLLDTAFASQSSGATVFRGGTQSRRTRTKGEPRPAGSKLARMAREGRCTLR